MTAHTPREEAHIHTQKNRPLLDAFYSGVPGMRSDDVCWMAALDALMLSWFDLVLLCTSHTHCSYWHSGESWEHGCRRTAAAFVAARLSGCFYRKTQHNPSLFLIVLCACESTIPRTEAYTHTQKHRPWLPLQSTAAT